MPKVFITDFKAIVTIFKQCSLAFDESSSATAGSFAFHTGRAHLNGWGNTPVNRDAAAEELSNNCTAGYCYKTEGQCLRIEPGELVNNYSSSFKEIN